MWWRWIEGLFLFNSFHFLVDLIHRCTIGLSVNIFPYFPLLHFFKQQLKKNPFLFLLLLSFPGAINNKHTGDSLRTSLSRSAIIHLRLSESPVESGVDNAQQDTTNYSSVMLPGRLPKFNYIIKDDGQGSDCLAAYSDDALRGGQRMDRHGWANERFVPLEDFPVPITHSSICVVSKCIKFKWSSPAMDRGAWVAKEAR